MTELADFGIAVLVVGVGLSAAVALNKLTQRISLPAPALFLIAATVISDLWPSLEVLSIRTVERIGVVALIVILFDGGMDIGWRRLRVALVPVASLGIVGTFATAAGLAIAAHALFGFSWLAAWIVGTALAPTDPAVMFSVLGNREIGGRAGTILEGESGANDPIGIALMVGLLELEGKSGSSAWTVVPSFALELGVGLGVGLAGAWALVQVQRRVSLPSPGLYPVQTLGAALVLYGLASALHGSGFLAVFVAGLAFGDVRVPNKREIERFHHSLSSLAEIVVFAALGLTIHTASLGREQVWLDGLVLAVTVAFVVRPLVVALLLAPVRLRRAEKIFVAWGGLKGAVPILLAAFAVLEGVPESHRLYGIVAVAVGFSVVVQGLTLPALASRLGMRVREEA